MRIIINYSIIILLLLAAACKKNYVDVKQEFGRVTIDKVHQVIGPIGSRIEITGNNFVYQSEDCKAYIGEIPLIIKEVSMTRLMLEIPANATTGNIRLSFNRINPSNKYDYSGQIDSAIVGPLFTVDNNYVPVPIVAALKDTARPGDVIELKGYNFAATGIEVDFGTASSIPTAVTDTSITVIVPKTLAPGNVNLIIRQGDKRTAPISFTVLEPLPVLVVYYTTYSRVMKAYMEDGALVKEILYENADEYPVSLVADPDRKMLYWIDQYNSQVFKLPMDGSSAAQVIYTMADGLFFPGCLALDQTNNFLYISNYTDDTNQQILKADLSTLAPLVPVITFSDFVYPWSVAVIPETGDLYWTEIVSNNVMKGKMDGSGSPQILYNINSPDIVTVDHTAGKIYALAGNPRFIATGSTNGEGTTVNIMSDEYLKSTSDIELDTKNKFIYWVSRPNGGSAILYRARMDGTEIEEVYTGVEAGPNDGAQSIEIILE